MKQGFEIDDIDRAIISALRQNGRATNQQIAEGLNLTAATVSSRIRRMEAANKLRVVAVSDFRAHGHNVLLEVAIEVRALLAGSAVPHQNQDAGALVGGEGVDHRATVASPPPRVHPPAGWVEGEM